MAIFAYGNKEKAQNVVIEIQSNGKNFVVGLAIRPSVGGRVLEVNSVRNVFPKDNAEWLNRIAQDKSLYLDKKRIQTLINQQRTNLADVEYLDLNSIANIIATFVNPQISEEENSGEQANLTSEDSNTRMKVEDQWQDMLTEKEREAMQAEHDAVDEGGYMFSNETAFENSTNSDEVVMFRAKRKSGNTQRLNRYAVENIFGGIWIRTKQEYAKFASAVESYAFEEDGEGVAYTDNFLYAYYWNINSQPIPYASVYLNREQSQDIVNQVNQEIKDGRKDKRAKEYFDTAVARYELLQSADHADNGNHNGASDRRGNVRLGNSLLRKGRYYNNPSLYVKTRRTDEVNRKGEGAVSDYDVTMASDPVSKAIGEPRYGRGKKMREYAERQRRLMAQKVKEIAEKLNLDNVEIVTDSSTLSGKKAKAKGFYNVKTDKITIVVPNHTNVFDVAETVLHEAVAHYGLRKLFGKHFDTFLDNVYESAEPEIRKKIADLAAKNGWDFRTATEEYLASLAENTEFEHIQYNGWWSQIKEMFYNMLTKLGIADFSKQGVTLSDNELRYILWRSYRHLKGDRGILFEAEDVTKQYDLGVGNYSAPKVAEVSEDGYLYRDGDFAPRDRALAREQYERVIKSGSYQFREAVQDSMLGLRRLMEAILPKISVKDIAGYENPYIFENRMSSTNAAEQHVYFTRYMKPLLKEIGKLCGAKKAKREALDEYLMAKHGLERNEYMRNKAEENGEDTDRDFAGLTGLTGEADWKIAEQIAQCIKSYNFAMLNSLLYIFY